MKALENVWTGSRGYWEEKLQNLKALSDDKVSESHDSHDRAILGVTSSPSDCSTKRSYLFLKHSPEFILKLVQCSSENQYSFLGRSQTT